LTTTMIYHAGKLQPADPAQIEAFKAKLSEGDHVTVEFSVNRHHSERAFRMFHALVRDLSRGLGVDYQTMKDQVCCQWGVAMPIQDALHAIPEWPGHMVTPWESGEVWIRKSTTAYTVDEMNSLISGAQLMALENDIDIGA